MKKTAVFLAIALLICLAVPCALADTPIELSGYMYGNMAETASMIGGMKWDGDWYYANDIKQAYIGKGITLAGNFNNEIKFIMIDKKNDYCLFGLTVGMSESILDDYMAPFQHRSYKDAAGTNYVITLSERDDGYVEIIWVVANKGKLTHVIYEVGYGHD